MKWQPKAMAPAAADVITAFCSLLSSTLLPVIEGVIECGLSRLVLPVIEGAPSRFVLRSCFILFMKMLQAAQNVRSPKIPSSTPACRNAPGTGAS